LMQNQRATTDHEARREVQEHIAANVDTTAKIISHILHYIATPLDGTCAPSKFNRFQAKLFGELSGFPYQHDESSSTQTSSLANQLKLNNINSLPYLLANQSGGLSNVEAALLADEMKFEHVNALPFLEAVVKECLRLFAGLPSLRLRVVPPGGEVFVLNGKWIPEGTEIEMQPWSMRDQSVFERPDEFCPERWLPSSLGGWGPEPGSNAYDEMNLRFMPFGLGTHFGAGRNMALMVTKLVVASLVRDFEIIVDERETNEKTMEPRDSHFFSFRKSRACGLIMVPRSTTV